MKLIVYLIVLLSLLSCKQYEKTEPRSSSLLQGWHLDSIYGPWASRGYFKKNECVLSFDTLNNQLHISKSIPDIDSGTYKYFIADNIINLEGLEPHEDFRVVQNKNTMEWSYVSVRIADYEYYYFFTKH
jgi:hypothetical protein